jgi:hypothetical protein
MGDGMPYHLEKGGMLRLLEQALNGDSVVGRRKRQRALLAELTASEGKPDWALALLDSVYATDWWAKKKAPTDPMTQHFLNHWLGYFQGPNGVWVRRDDAVVPQVTGPDGPLTKTGYWTSYRGEVSEVLRRAGIWALQLALGLAPTDVTGSGRRWPLSIELYWKCETAWFEAWVLRRPHGIWPFKRGSITLLLLTPGYQGAHVATGPHAVAATTRSRPRVPGTLAKPSWEPEYQQFDDPLDPDTHDGYVVPSVAPFEREHGMWVVTHRQHELLTAVDDEPIGANNAAPSPVGIHDIPRLAHYSGVPPIVVVAPSMAAGGVLHDGGVQ